MLHNFIGFQEKPRTKERLDQGKERGTQGKNERYGAEGKRKKERKEVCF